MIQTFSAGKVKAIEFYRIRYNTWTGSVEWRHNAFVRLFSQVTEYKRNQTLRWTRSKEAVQRNVCNGCDTISYSNASWNPEPMSLVSCSIVDQSMDVPRCTHYAQNFWTMCCLCQRKNCPSYTWTSNQPMGGLCTRRAPVHWHLFPIYLLSRASD
jgi:hypothetical protein